MFTSSDIFRSQNPSGTAEKKLQAGIWDTSHEGTLLTSWFIDSFSDGVIWTFYLFGCFPLHVQLGTTYVRCLQRPKQGIGSTRTGIAESWELPFGCWESNLGPPEVRPVLLRIEPSLQPSKIFMQRRPTYQGMMLPTVGCVLPHQSSMKNNRS